MAFPKIVSPIQTNAKPVPQGAVSGALVKAGADSGVNPGYFGVASSHIPVNLS